MKNYFSKKLHCYTASEVMIASKMARDQYGMCLCSRYKDDWKNQSIYAFTSDTERAIKWLNNPSDDEDVIHFVVLAIDL